MLYRHACESLIEMGADTSCRDDRSWTPLDYAAQNGHPKTMKVLLDNDALVDACDSYGTTPLHHASQFGHVNCIKMLLDHEASISKKNKSGKNCLDIAAENSKRDACMAMIKHKRYKQRIYFNFSKRKLHLSQSMVL